MKKSILIISSLFFLIGCAGTTQKQISIEQKMEGFFKQRELLNKNREEILNEFTKCIEKSNSQKEFNSCKKQRDYKLSEVNKKDKKIDYSIRNAQEQERLKIFKEYLKEDKKKQKMKKEKKL